MGDGLEVGALDVFTPPMINHQAAGNASQKGTRGFEFQAFGFLQQADERVLSQVRCICRIAQAAAQPPVEPAVMGAVKRLHNTFTSDVLSSRHSHRLGQTSQMIISRIVWEAEKFCNADAYRSTVGRFPTQNQDASHKFLRFILAWPKA